LSGVPTAPTANAGTNTTQVATTAFVQGAVAGLVDTAPETLDTLNELAAALGDDPNFATTVTNSIAGKVSLTGDETVAGVKTFSNNSIFNGNVGIGTSSPTLSLDVVRSNTTSFSGTGYRVARFASTSAINGDEPGVVLGYDTAGAGIIAAATQSTGQPLAFWTYDGSVWDERARIDSNGNVGIGTSSPLVKMQIMGAHTTNSEPVAYFGSSNSNNDGLNGGVGIVVDPTNIVGTVISLGSNSQLAFGSGTGTEKMRITSTGNVGIGTSSPSQKLDVNGNAIVRGAQDFNATDETATLYIGDTASYIQAVYDGGLDFYQNSTFRMRIQGGTGNVGIGTSSPLTKLTVSNGYISQTGGGVNTYFGYDGGGGSLAGTTTNHYFRFITNDLERMRIDSSGNLLVGRTTTVTGNSNCFVAGGTTFSDVAIFGIHTADNSNVRGIIALAPNYDGDDGYFFIGSRSDTDTFYVRTSGNVTNLNNSYGAISDIKAKENVIDATPKLEKLKQVRIVNYNLIGQEQKQIGVIAQELEKIFPSMVEESSERDEDGNEIDTTTKSVKYSVFVPILIKAMQEQQAIIDDLKARIEALEG
jgi:hypothetical protein